MTGEYETFTCPVKECDYHDSGWTDDRDYNSRRAAHVNTHVHVMEGKLIDAVTISPGTSKAAQMEALSALLAQAPKGTELVLTLHAWEVSL